MVRFKPSTDSGPRIIFERFFLNVIYIRYYFKTPSHQGAYFEVSDEWILQNVCMNGFRIIGKGSQLDLPNASCTL